MSLLALNSLQIIGLWEDLMLCLFNKNKYDGTIAEIYMFRLLPADPAEGNPTHPRYVEFYREANRTLYDLCRLFEERQNITLYLFEGENGKAISLKNLIGENMWVYRVHIGIKDNEVR